MLPDLAGLPVQYAPRWDDQRIAGRAVGGRWTPEWVMVHHTAGTDSLDWLANGRPHPPVPGAHFLIDRDGTIHWLSKFQTYHAGRGSGWGVPDDSMNAYAWGIEVESLGRERDFTDAQRASLTALMGRLCAAVGRGPEAIINHRDWSPTKSDSRYDRHELRSWVEEDDMPLSDDDIDRIAERVWKYVIANQAPKPQRMQKMLRDVWESTTAQTDDVDA